MVFSVFTDTHTHHHSQFRTFSSHPKETLCPSSLRSPSPRPPLITRLRRPPAPAGIALHVSGPTRERVCPLCLASLAQHHVVRFPCCGLWRLHSSYGQLANTPLHGESTRCSSIHLLVDVGVVATFLTTMNDAVNTCIYVSVWTYVFISLGCIPSKGPAGSHDNSRLF